MTKFVIYLFACLAPLACSAEPSSGSAPRDIVDAQETPPSGVGGAPIVETWREADDEQAPLLEIESSGMGGDRGFEWGPPICEYVTPSTKHCVRFPKGSELYETFEF